MTENAIHENLVLRNATIAGRNFQGRKTDYNNEGNRRFSVVFRDQETIDNLLADGWTVKVKHIGNNEEDVIGYLDVAVWFDRRPPQCFMISGGKQRQLNEDQIGVIDNADLERVDLVIGPKPWTRNGRSGIKAYLKAMYVTLRESELADDYRDIPFYDESDE